MGNTTLLYLQHYDVVSQWDTSHRFHSLAPSGVIPQETLGDCWRCTRYHPSSGKMKVFPAPSTCFILPTVHLYSALFESTVHANVPVPTFMKYKYK